MIKKTLTTRMLPLAYLLVFQGVFWGIGMLLGTSGIRGTRLYETDGLIGAQLWGLTALISAIVCYVGLVKLWKTIVYIGAAGMFACWLFAGIEYSLRGYVILALLALTNVFMYGYIALGSALGLLERKD